MPFEHKDNSGSIFRNERRDNDRQPSHRGSAKIDGTEYWISAWVNETNSGSKYFSLKFEPKEVNNFSEPKDYDTDEDVPF